MGRTPGLVFHSVVSSLVVHSLTVITVSTKEIKYISIVFHRRTVIGPSQHSSLIQSSISPQNSISARN